MDENKLVKYNHTEDVETYTRRSKSTGADDVEEPNGEIIER